MHLSTFRIAWRNLSRNRKRTALAVCAIAVGQFALLATQGLMRGYADQIREAVTGPMIGHVQVHAPGWRDERAMDLYVSGVAEIVGEIRAIPSVSSAAGRIFAPVLVAPGNDAFVAMVMGLDMQAESRPHGLLSGIGRPLAPGCVLVGYRLARRIGVEPGAEIAILGQAADGSYATDLFTVQDIVECASDPVNQTGVILPLQTAQDLFVLPDRAHEIVVRARPETDARLLTDGLRALPSLKGMEVLPWQELVPELVMIIDMAHYVGYFVLVLVFIAAVAGIANTLMMATFERMHEFGMLLALGSRPRRLVRMILVEALLLGVLGVVLGTAAGGLFVAATAHSGIDMASWGGPEASEFAYQGLKLPLHIYPRLHWSDAPLGLAAVLFTSVVAALWPASVAARLEPMEAMRA